MQDIQDTKLNLSGGADTANNNVDDVHAVDSHAEETSRVISRDSETDVIRTLVFNTASDAHSDANDKEYSTGVEDNDDDNGFFPAVPPCSNEEYSADDEEGEEEYSTAEEDNNDEDEEAKEECAGAAYAPSTPTHPPGTPTNTPNSSPYTPRKGAEDDGNATEDFGGHAGPITSGSRDEDGREFRILARREGDDIDIPAAVRAMSWMFQIPNEEDLESVMRADVVQEAAYRIIHAAYRGEKDFEKFETWRAAQEIFLARGTVATAAAASSPSSQSGDAALSSAAKSTIHPIKETDFSSDNLKLSPATSLLVSFIEACEAARVLINARPFGTPPHVFKVYYFMLHHFAFGDRDWGWRMYRLVYGADGECDLESKEEKNHDDGFWGVYKRSCPFFVDDGWDDAVRRLRNVMGGFGELLFEVREFDFDVEAGGSIV